MKYYYNEEISMQNSEEIAMDELKFTMEGFNNFLIYGNKYFEPYCDNNFDYDFDELSDCMQYCNTEEIIRYLSHLWQVEENQIDVYYLSGSVQREWNILYYIKNDISNESLAWIELAYFNLGYVIYDEDNCPCYVDSLYIEDIKELLGDENVELIIGSIEDLKETNNKKTKQVLIRDIDDKEVLGLLQVNDNIDLSEIESTIDSLYSDWIKEDFPDTLMEYLSNNLPEKWNAILKINRIEELYI